ncbi:MAG: response regulator [Colwellia polaris]|jgi:tetratricopeptide (TPR) repeat protein|uniref:response regulator n=1 Tax=Colwellia polaris TaxID=326537 RepID=UPI000A16E847|nr:response regulator [Colwellia polaris]|tara:strand:- start:53991 stop:55640 length:1650 start_codon:yes stop_codon:yes gene_type:complete
MEEVDKNTLAQLDQLNVLIIDDNLLVHSILKESLFALGIKEVRCAQNAYYGLRLCDEMHFHIVICAFNVKSDKDGFHLLEELKFKGHVTKTTVLIFLSTETNESLVNSIIELQPDDFWTKPLAIKKVRSRFIAILKVKQVLFNINNAIDKKSYAKALYFAERHLKNEKLAFYHPNINRIIGESYLALREFVEAEKFYFQLFKQYKYSWVYLGYAKALLKQGRLEEISDMLKTLIDKPETRFGAHDMMAQYFIEQEDYEQAYEEIKKAMALAPRNIERNKKSWDLARLTHDHKGQYVATKNIAQQAKNSIHDSPELLLNIIRSSIDLACATPDESANDLLQQTDRYIRQFEHDLHDANLFKQQLIVVKARLHNVRNERDKATKLVENHMSLQPTNVVEDNLDRVKVLHELGMREDAIDLLAAINKQIAGDSLNSQVVRRYIAQETQQREEIHFTAKELNSMAVEHFQKNRLLPALDAIKQALTLSPNNTKLLFSELKILIKIKQEEQGTSEHEEATEKIIAELDTANLEGKSRATFEDLLLKWQKAKEQD